MEDKKMSLFRKDISPKVAFGLVAFFLGELGDGLNIFQVGAGI